MHTENIQYSNGWLNFWSYIFIMVLKMYFLCVILRPNAPYYMHFLYRWYLMSLKKKWKGEVLCVISSKQFCFISPLFCSSNAFMKHWIVNLTDPESITCQPAAVSHFLLLDQQVSLVTPYTFICCSEFSHFAVGSSFRYSFASPPPQSSLRTPSFRGPLAALRSARLASSSFLLSSRFFLDSSALLRPGEQ